MDFIFKDLILTGNNLAIGGNSAWFSCTKSGPNGQCTAKAKVVYEKVTNSEGEEEYTYKYERVSGHEVRNINITGIFKMINI